MRGQRRYHIQVDAISPEDALLKSLQEWERATGRRIADADLSIEAVREIDDDTIRDGIREYGLMTSHGGSI